MSRPLLLLFVLVALATACSTGPVRVSSDRFAEHVAWLADDARQGRQTGSPELQQTAEYIADEFRRAGLEPAGDDGTWFQGFQAAGSRVLLDGNGLTLGGKALELHDEWVPFSSSTSGDVVGSLVFAGYGISDEDGGYDDYAGLDVRDSIVVVLRNAPGASTRVQTAGDGGEGAHHGAGDHDGADPHGAGDDDEADHHGAGDEDGHHGAGDHGGDAHHGASGDSAAHGVREHGGGHGDGAGGDHGQPSDRYYGGPKNALRSFDQKINTAFMQGAAAVLVVNDPASFPPGSETDVPLKYGPRRGISASLPAAHLTAAAGMRVLSGLGLDLAALQSDIDGAWHPRSRMMPHAEAQLAIRAEREQVDTVNVVGLLRGSDPRRAHEHVVVGAHMDHVGLGLRSGSLGGDAAAGEVHNGADDNASGTSAVIEIAHALGDRRLELERSVVFIAFGAEEWGLLGSAHYVDDPALPLEDLVTMINMDMIGRSADGQVSVGGVGTSPAFGGLVGRAHAALGSPLSLDIGGGVASNSDQAPFFEREIPVLTLFTGLHDDYHRPGDDTEKINTEDGARIASLAGELVRRVAGDMERPVFLDAEALAAAVRPPAPADPHAAGQGDQQVSGYRVVFGSQPDMTYTRDDGVRISGTRAGSPAARAGLQAGDIIVALDGKTIRNLEDYALLLFSHRPGDEIVVRVRREEELVDLTAKLEGRSGDS